MSENEDNEQDIPVVRKIIHEIRDTRDKPKKVAFGSEGEGDKDNAEYLSQIAQKFFEDEKEKLIAEYPESATKIRSVESGFDLELLAEKLQENAIPTKAPAGHATLPPKPSTEGLTQAENEGSLINRLYGQAKTRDSNKKQQKQEALEKIDRMYKAMVENPKLGARVKDIPNAVRDFNPCPKCGAIVEGNFNIKGSECPKCGFVAGQGSYTRKVY